jgi:gliding motility-associated-like protein
MNLVPNPSFELLDTCPTSSGEIQYCLHWFQPNDPAHFPSGSTDYFNTCSVNSGVPSNYAGFQFARTGLAYAGICPFFSVAAPNDSREYLEVKLDSALKVDTKYCVSFFASLGNKTRNPIDLLSAYFSPDSAIYSSVSYSYFPVIPQISNPTGKLLADTLNWMEVNGTFVANGGERFMTIGNFYPGSMTHYIIYDSNTISYYYIDDVSVSEAPTANTGITRDSICPGDMVNLGVPSKAGFIYQWFPITGLSSANISNPKASPTQTTTYTLVVSETCCSTCSDTARVTIYVKDCPATITPPNVFTPNADGINDVWLPVLTKESEITSYHCSIFDRWGAKLFDSDKPLQGWDGRDQTGVSCVDGVYYYVITANGGNGKSYNQTGYFQLIR